MATEGPGEIQASLVAAAGSAGVAGRLRLVAEHLSLRAAFNGADDAAASPRLAGDAGVRRVDLRGATLTSLAPGPGATFMVFPTAAGARLQSQAEGWDVRPAGAASVAERRYVESNTPLLERDALGTMVITSGAALRLSIHGSFIIVLWDWSVLGSDAAQSGLFSSGPQGVGPDAVGLGVAPSRAQQLYVEAHGARLDIVGAEPGSLRTWTHAARLRAGAPVVVDTLQGPLRQEPGQGTLELDLRSGPHAAMATVAAGMPVASGAAVQVVRTPFAIPPLLTATLGAALVPGVGTAAIAGGRRLEARRLGRLETAFEAGDAEATVRLSAPLLASRHFGEDAALMRFEMLVRLGRLSEATSLLQAMGPFADAQTSAAVELVRAVFAALGADHATAARHLANCLGQTGEFYDEIVDNPILKTARESALVRAALATRPGGYAA